MNQFEGLTTQQLMRIAENLWDDIMSKPVQSDFEQNELHRKYDEVMEEIAIRSNEVTDESH